MSAEPDEPRSPASSWKLALKLAVSGGLLFYLSRRVDFREIARFLARADTSLLALALALYLAGQALSALKWRRLATAVGFRASSPRFVAYYFIGMFFNAFGFGTVGGDVVRAFYLAGSEGRRGLALNTVIADRVSGLLVLLAIALGALLLFRHYELPAAIYWGVVGLSSALLAVWRLLPSLLPLVLAPENRFRHLIERDLAPYWSDARLLASVAALSLAFHLSQIGVLLLLVRALGLGVPWSYCFVFGPLVNIMAAVPDQLERLGGPGERIRVLPRARRRASRLGDGLRARLVRGGDAGGRVRRPRVSPSPSTADARAGSNREREVKSGEDALSRMAQGSETESA